MGLIFLASRGRQNFSFVLYKGLEWNKIKYSGNALLWSIFHYERFGGDPQKRGLQNRLVSELVLSALLGKSNVEFDIAVRH